MAFSKAPLFPELPFKQSFWSRNLGHPARVIFLEYLLENGTTSFSILKNLVPLAPPTVSRHLRYLRENGLIVAHQRHPGTFYSLHPTNCKNLAFLITELTLSFASDRKTSMNNLSFEWEDQ